MSIMSTMSIVSIVSIVSTKSIIPLRLKTPAPRFTPQSKTSASAHDSIFGGLQARLLLFKSIACCSIVPCVANLNNTAEFPKKIHRVIRKFRLPESLIIQVLFAVDPDIRFAEML